MELTANMIWSGAIMTAVLIIFTLGKSPVFRVDRAGAAVIGSVLMIGTKVLTFDEASAAVDHRTIVILFSLMVVVANLKLAGFFEKLGDVVERNVHNQHQLLAATIAVSGIVSAVAINDIVCLLFTPVVMLLCRKFQCNPLPHLLGVALASNMGSAATLIGNPQNILVGGLSGLPFLDYFGTAAPIAGVGLFGIYAILTCLYRADLASPLNAGTEGALLVHGYLIRKSLLTLAAVILAYINGMDLALAAAAGGAFLLVTRRVKPNKIYTSIDFNLLVIFIGLFVVVAGVEKSGLMNYILRQFSFSGFESMGAFAGITVVVSNLVSNVPAVLLLKFFIPQHDPAVWWKGLALFSTLAGNLTITGSIANLIVAEIALGQKVQITAWQYFRAGFPLTVGMTLLGIVWLRFWMN